MEIASLVIMTILMVAFPVAAATPTTLQGPFPPRTVQFDVSLRKGSQDLEPKHPRVVRTVKGNEPEQISLALSTPDAMWVTWTTGTPIPPPHLGSQLSTQAFHQLGFRILQLPTTLTVCSNHKILQKSFNAGLVAPALSHHEPPPQFPL